MDWYLDPDRPKVAQELRREVVEYLTRHAADPDEVPMASVAVEELVVNALSHARGPVWVSVDWGGEKPLLTVHDLGDAFDLEPSLPADPYASHGRGLYLAAHLTEGLERAAKRAVGNRVSTRLQVRRPKEVSFGPPRRSLDPLPQLSEALPDGGFPRESFLRALVVQLAQAVEGTLGPEVAERTVTQVGSDIGGRMEEEYRAARRIVDRLTPEEMGDCYVRLKRAIQGDFYVIEATPERIVLGNRRCPFGEVVRRAPALCRMTSSVFGGIAARNAGSATVVLEERISVGDPECRVVVYLGEAPVSIRGAGHRYSAPAGP